MPPGAECLQSADACHGPETGTASSAPGQGGMVMATADTACVAEARNWKCVPSGMLRQTPGDR